MTPDLSQLRAAKFKSEDRAVAEACEVLRARLGVAHREGCFVGGAGVAASGPFPVVSEIYGADSQATVAALERFKREMIFYVERGEGNASGNRIVICRPGYRMASTMLMKMWIHKHGLWISS
jgi:hypothetical protein